LLLAVVPALGTLYANLQPDKSPKEQYMAVVQEYQKLQADFTKLLQAAKTAEEQKDALAKRPDPATFAKRMLEIANKYPKDAVALDALGWILRTTPSGETADKALAKLAADHGTNPLIGDLCTALSRSANPAAEKLLRTVLEKNPNKEAQGMACFALAQNFKSRADAAIRQKNSDTATDLSKRAEEYFDRVAKDFADVKYQKTTLGEAVVPVLFEMRFLAVGKTVPEIEAEDIDGKTFKISDYRGKVILLDFWGHW